MSISHLRYQTRKDIVMDWYIFYAYRDHLDRENMYDISPLLKVIVKYNEHTFPTKEYNQHIEQRRLETENVWKKYYSGNIGE